MLDREVVDNVVRLLIDAELTPPGQLERVLAFLVNQYQAEQRGEPDAGERRLSYHKVLYNTVKNQVARWSAKEGVWLAIRSALGMTEELRHLAALRARAGAGESAGRRTARWIRRYVETDRSPAEPVLVGERSLPRWATPERAIHRGRCRRRKPGTLWSRAMRRNCWISSPVIVSRSLSMAGWR